MAAENNVKTEEHVLPKRRGATSRTPPEVEEDILRLVRAIQYGSLEITIHDSRVVQVERREKLRFDPGTQAGKA